MADMTRFHMRRTTEDAEIMHRLADRYGVTESGVVRIAIRALDEHGLTGKATSDELAAEREANSD